MNTQRPPIEGVFFGGNTLIDEDLISVEVTKLVFDTYGYQYNEEKTTDRTVIFDAVREPYRRNLPQISFDSPDFTDSDGDKCYANTKIIDTLSLVFGLASIGEAILVIEAKKKKLH